jgi:hypothetical protein
MFLPESQAGVALLTNGSGYPTAHFAKVALAYLLDKDVSALPFIRADDELSRLTGSYESYQGTMSASVIKEADFLKLLIHGEAKVQEIILVPERLGEKMTFFTLAGGRRLPVSFQQRGSTIELIYERYKFKHTGS